jgi:hypothetical protein
MHLSAAKRKNYMCSSSDSRCGEKHLLSKPQNTQASVYKARERIYSAISAGAILILIGIVYVASLPSNLLDSIINFFGSFTLAQVPSTGIYLPAPMSPASHAVLYGAIFQFCVGVGILQIVMLALRFTSQSPIGKTAETMGNLVYWFGTAYLVVTYLNSTTTISKWFVFWAGILIILGLSFIARSFVLLAKKKMSG